MSSRTDPQRAAKDSRKRSRSPYRDTESHRHVKHRRSRSPHHTSSHRHQDHQPSAVKLPFGAHKLHKHDLAQYRALFADYLDIQKHLDIYTLIEDEVKGRWKSFLGKWNRRELAEGWYDPETKRRTDERYAQEARPRIANDQEVVPTAGPRTRGDEHPHENQEDDDDDDDYGPILPNTERGTRSLGPALPNLQDLQHRQELTEEDRAAHFADLKYERKLNRKTEKERLEELVPRAEPGSRERQLEKKRDAAAASRSFRDEKEAGVEEVGEGDLMGGDDEFKAQVKAQTRQKNEREIRKEEVLRARAVEREERMAAHRMKEDKTMEMLKGLAKQRYG